MFAIGSLVVVLVAMFWLYGGNLCGVGCYRIAYVGLNGCGCCDVIGVRLWLMSG